MSFSSSSGMSSSAVKLMPDPPANLSLGRTMVCAGTAACVADLATFPFDVAKVQLQVSTGQMSSSLAAGAAKPSPLSAGLVGTLMKMARTEGVASWWNGIVPGLHRQVS